MVKGKVTKKSVKNKSFWNSSSRFFGKEVSNKSLFFGFVFVAVIVLAIVIFSNQSSTLTGNSISSDFVDLWSKGAESGTKGTGIVKTMLLVLLFTLIMSILQFMSVFHWSLNGIFAVIISYISLVYLTPADIYSYLAVYSAASGAILLGIPFVMLILSSIMIMTPFTVKDGKVVSVKKKGKIKLIQYLLVSILWLIFDILLFSLIFSWGVSSVGVGMLALAGIITVFSLIMIFKPSWLASRVAKSVAATEQNELDARLEQERRRLEYQRKMDDLKYGYNQGDGN